MGGIWYQPMLDLEHGEDSDSEGQEEEDEEEDEEDEEEGGERGEGKNKQGRGAGDGSGMGAGRSSGRRKRRQRRHRREKAPMLWRLGVANLKRFLKATQGSKAKAVPSTSPAASPRRLRHRRAPKHRESSSGGGHSGSAAAGASPSLASSPLWFALRPLVQSTTATGPASQGSGRHRSVFEAVAVRAALGAADPWGFEEQEETPQPPLLQRSAAGPSALEWQQRAATAAAGEGKGKGLDQLPAPIFRAIAKQTVRDPAV